MTPVDDVELNITRRGAVPETGEKEKLGVGGTFTQPPTVTLAAFPAAAQGVTARTATARIRNAPITFSFIGILSNEDVYKYIHSSLTAMRSRHTMNR
jgi:hypothetical protein